LNSFNLTAFENFFYSCLLADYSGFYSQWQAKKQGRNIFTKTIENFLIIMNNYRATNLNKTRAFT